MKDFPWWTEDQLAFEKKINTFVEEVIPLDQETRWQRKFPKEIFKRISEEGFTGAGVPKAYGGLGLGATGACIAAEAISRMPGPGRVFVGNMLGGCARSSSWAPKRRKNTSCRCSPKERSAPS